MRVLLISPLPPPSGGIASWTKGYLESDKSKEHDISIVNEAVIGTRIKEFNTLHYIEELKRTGRILSDLLQQMRKSRIELVHLNSSFGRLGFIRDYLCARVVKHYRVPLITHFHCDVSYWVNGRFRLLIFRKLARLSDVVLTLNAGSREYVLGHAGKDSIIVPNFVSEEFYALTLQDKEINDQIKHVLFVGHVEEAKGCNVIYAAAKRFPEIQFTLLGYVDEKFKRMDAPSNISLMGEVSKERVMDEMLQSDLFLFPTHTEGFPTVILEAMAAGLPIISTPIGAIPDMIEKRGGILTPVDDADAVADAILVMQDQKVRAAMSVWNKQKVQHNYRIDHIMNRLFEIYAKGS